MGYVPVDVDVAREFAPGCNGNRLLVRGRCGERPPKRPTNDSWLSGQWLRSFRPAPWPSVVLDGEGLWAVAGLSLFKIETTTRFRESKSFVSDVRLWNPRRLRFRS